MDGRGISGPKKKWIDNIGGNTRRYGVNEKMVIRLEMKAQMKEKILQFKIASDYNFTIG